MSVLVRAVEAGCPCSGATSASCTDFLVEPGQPPPFPFTSPLANEADARLLKLPFFRAHPQGTQGIMIQQQVSRECAWAPALCVCRGLFIPECRVQGLCALHNAFQARKGCQVVWAWPCTPARRVAAVHQINLFTASDLEDSAMAVAARTSRALGDILNQTHDVASAMSFDFCSRGAEQTRKDGRRVEV